MRWRLIALVAAAAVGACQQLLGLTPGTLGGRTSAGGGGGAGGDGVLPKCACLEPRDACARDSQGEPGCAVQGARCDAVTPCPTGYACDEASTRCLCADLEKCGIRCATDADCPVGPGGDAFRCNRGACKPSPPCLTDRMCGAKQVCRHAQTLSCGHCLATGSGATGAKCAHDGDCASGACAGVCVTRCRSNANCPANLVCSGGDALSVDPVCKVLAATMDCPGCTAPSEYCFGGQCRQGPACEVAADCQVTGGDCAAPADKSADVFACTNSSAQCDKGDLYLAAGGYCLGGPCWQASDCPAPYTRCVTAAANCPGPGGTCARQLH